MLNNYSTHGVIPTRQTETPLEMLARLRDIWRTELIPWRDTTDRENSGNNFANENK